MLSLATHTRSQRTLATLAVHACGGTDKMIISYNFNKFRDITKNFEGFPGKTNVQAAPRAANFRKLADIDQKGYTTNCEI